MVDPDFDDTGDAGLSAVRVRERAAGDGAGDAFRAFLQAIPLPAWLHDVETLDVLAVNDALVALTRRTRASLVGAKTHDLYDPADRVAALRHLERLRSPEGAADEQAQVLRLAVAGGGSVSVRVASRAAPAVRAGARLAVAHEAAAEGRPLSDLPPRPQGGPAKSDQRWRMFVEMSPLPAVITRIDPATSRAAEFLVVNDALAEATGFTRGELMAVAPLDLIHPDDRGELFRDRARASTEARAPKLDSRLWRHVRKDGSYFDVHLGSVSLDFEGHAARLTVLSDVSARRRAEAAIAQSEQRYRTLFEVCPIAACVYDLATLRFLAVNDAMAQQYDFTREELLSMTALDLVAPEDADVMRALLDELRDPSTPEVLHRAHVVRHRVRGGAEIDVELIEAPLVYGGARARLVLHKDVTEHKRAEIDLVRRARVDAFRADLGAAMMADEPLPAHFERVVEAMVSHLDLDSVGVWVLDEATGQLELSASDGGLDVATAAGRRLRFGETWIGRAASRGAPVLLAVSDPGMRPMEVAHAHERGITNVAALPLVARGRVLGVVTAGSARPLPHDLVVLLRATAAQISHAVGAAFAYEALRIGESLSRSILANMLSALVTLSEDGVIESANPAATGAFGYSRDELIGRPFVALFDVPSRDSKALLAEARGRVTEQRGRRKSGETFPCDLRLFHLESLRGPGYAAILHDISERYEVERLKTEFVSVVSHELRTPLTALRGSIGLLAGGVMGALPDDAMELLQIAERNTKRLISLVNDILDLERLQRGKLELFIQPVRALSIVDRSIESVKPYADQERIRLEVRCVDEVVLGDGDRLVQVLVNLLSNAVKFSPAGATVEIATEIEPAAVVFRVTDHGRGVPATHRRLIFERFGQVHMSDSREKGGTGLGLAISKAIVEQHDGVIGVESEEGRGSTFWFRVPRGL